MTNEDLHDATNAGLERACAAAVDAERARESARASAEREGTPPRRRRERETRDALRADANARRDDDKSFRAREKRKRDGDSRAGAARTGSRRRNARSGSRDPAEDSGSTDEPHTREPTVPGKAHDATRTNVRNEPTVARRVWVTKCASPRAERNAPPRRRRLSSVTLSPPRRRRDHRRGPPRRDPRSRRRQTRSRRRQTRSRRRRARRARHHLRLPHRRARRRRPSSSPTAKRASVSVASARLRSAESLSFNSTFCTGSARCRRRWPRGACRRSRSSRRATAAAARFEPGRILIVSRSAPPPRRGARAQTLRPERRPRMRLAALPRRVRPSLRRLNAASLPRRPRQLLVLLRRTRTLSLSGFFRLFPFKNARVSSSSERDVCFPAAFLFGAGVHGRARCTAGRCPTPARGC